MRQSSPEVHTFFDEATNAACHIVKDPASNAVAIIDSILDFDAAAGSTETTHADKLIDEITRNDWKVAWILETHVHADHLSAAPYLAEKLGGKIAIGANITAVQKFLARSLMQVPNLRWTAANSTDCSQMGMSLTSVTLMSQ